jgi:hypothetical protein
MPGAPALVAGMAMVLLAACAPAATAKVRDAGAASSAQGTQHPGPAASSGAEACRSDEDCTIDLRPADGCCAGCLARAVTRSEQRRKDVECAAVRCAEPACAPPSTLAVATCLGGRCALRQESNQ